MKKIIIIISTVLVCSVSLFFLWTKILWKSFACNVAGSYECAETWTLKVNENDLIEIIQQIKSEHPELVEPNNTYPPFERYKYWCEFRFYYKDTDKNVYTWSRPNEDASYTTFAFIAIATNYDINNPFDKLKLDRQEINRDFEYFENKAEIKKFENKIVKLIEQKIKEKSRQ
jgi:hypothetical protein